MVLPTLSVVLLQLGLSESTVMGTPISMVNLNPIKLIMEVSHHILEPNVSSEGKCCLKNAWLVKQAFDRRNT